MRELRKRPVRRAIGIAAHAPPHSLAEPVWNRYSRTNMTARDPGRAMSDHRLEVMRNMLHAFNRDDVDAVIAAFGERCEIIEPSEMPDTPVLGFRGHRGIREWMANLRGTANAEFVLRTFTEAGDCWLCELASRGLSPASGVRVEWTTFAVVRIRDGKIEQVRVFLDRGEAEKAAGLLE